MRDRGELLTIVLDNMGDGVIVADPKGELLLHNREAARITGVRSPSGDMRQRVREMGLFHPDGRTRFAFDDLPLSRAVRGERSDNVRLAIRNPAHPDGIHVSVNGRPILDPEGRVQGGVIVVRDITGLRQTEIELKETVEKLSAQTHMNETIFNSIGDGVVVADREGHFTMFNPSAERIVGIGMTETGPEQWADRYGLFYRDRVTKFPDEEVPLVRAIRGKPSDDVQMFVRNPQIPEGLYLSVNGRTLWDDAGEIAGGVVVFRDVTEYVAREDALREAFDEGRLEIVDTVLHNIGNAINSVVVGMGTLKEELEKDSLLKRLAALAEAMESHRDDLAAYLANDRQGRQAIPFIAALAEDFTRANARLARIAGRVSARAEHINDIISAHKSFGDRDSPRKEIELRKALVEAVNITLGSLDRRDVRVAVSCGNAPNRIWIQEARFQQMMVNIVRNAIEAIDALDGNGGGSKPAVRVDAYTRGGDLVIDVADEGIGLTEQQQGSIFAAGYTTKKRGSGLGLHSAANYVIGTGGSIVALSEGPGRGTTLRINWRLDALTREAGNSRYHSPREDG